LPAPTDEDYDLKDYDIELGALSSVLCERTLCDRLSARREVAASYNERYWFLSRCSRSNATG